jgi:hypothetical protein
MYLWVWLLGCLVAGWVQVHELTNALTLARSDLVSAEGEVSRLKELHSQVKAALQESYSTQQQKQKQVRVGCRLRPSLLCCGWLVCGCASTACCQAERERATELLQNAG